MPEIMVHVVLKAPSKYSIAFNQSCIAPHNMDQNSCVKIQEGPTYNGEQW